jgi:diguanylate cyclase (GGDEF)-like protein
MLLKEVAARLRRCVRESDTVARLGGDEFTILLPEVSGETDAGVVAEKILLAMKEPVNLTTESRVITTSIGISVSPRDGVDAETLMKRADAAMYQVKASGRAGIRFYTEELSNNAPVRE